MLISYQFFVITIIHLLFSISSCHGTAFRCYFDNRTWTKFSILRMQYLFEQGDHNSILCEWSMHVVELHGDMSGWVSEKQVARTLKICVGRSPGFKISYGSDLWAWCLDHKRFITSEPDIRIFASDIISTGGKTFTTYTASSAFKTL